MFNVSVMRKRVPFPYSLSICISPPIMATRFLTMVMPSPVPTVLLVRLSSARLKGSKMCFIYSGFMPIPVSSIVKR